MIRQEAFAMDKGRYSIILDNRYLYDILTEGKYPERIPLDKLLTGAK